MCHEKQISGIKKLGACQSRLYSMRVTHTDTLHDNNNKQSTNPNLPHLLLGLGLDAHLFPLSPHLLLGLGLDGFEPLRQPLDDVGRRVALHAPVHGLLVHVHLHGHGARCELVSGGAEAVQVSEV